MLKSLHDPPEITVFWVNRGVVKPVPQHWGIRESSLNHLENLLCRANLSLRV